MKTFLLCVIIKRVSKVDGLFNLYKEAGLTSHDVVAKVRKVMKTKTVGHTGTLDPNATGVLIVAVGKATKVIEYMENDDKVYNAELTLGIKTDTEDIWGEVIEKRDISAYNIGGASIDKAIKSFIGRNIQIPPMYSALKVNGKKLYELAREGKEIERKGREIEIFDIYDINYSYDKVSFSVHCSKGTYIRTLCKDIGEKLGCGAAMSKLERVKVGNFFSKDSVKLETLEKSPEKYIIPLENVLEKFPVIELYGKDAEKYKNGVKIFKPEFPDGKFRIYIDKKIYGIGICERGIIKSEKKLTNL